MPVNGNGAQRLLEPLFTPEVNEQILKLVVPGDVEQRLQILRDKANEGALSPAEEREYAEYVDVLDIIAELRAGADAASKRRG